MPGASVSAVTSLLVAAVAAGLPVDHAVPFADARPPRASTAAGVDAAPASPEALVGAAALPGPATLEDEPPVSDDAPGADGDREAGPDPAAALAEAPRAGYPAGAASVDLHLDWGLGSAPAGKEPDPAALPDVPLPRLDPAFPVPTALRARVDFWKYVYASVGMYELVVHDTRHMDRIYEVVAMPARPADWRAYLKVRRATLKRARAKYRAILDRLATAGPGTRLTSEERRVEALLAGLPGGRAKYREAARRLHGQAGMRDRFLEALEAADAHLPEMERIFRERNLPIELTRLPFVESGFNPHASSKARAVGVWQFIRSTARRFDLVAKGRDLRKDVTASTVAAAKLLSHNYRETGSWPLALMAYHHGLAGIKRAVRVTGTTDVDVIVRAYKGRRFGYASRNYYAQFVAVNELYALVEHARARELEAEQALATIDRPS